MMTNLEFTTTAEYYVEIEMAVEHLPPIPNQEPQPRPPAVADAEPDEPIIDVLEAAQQVQAHPLPPEPVQRKVYEKPYQRRQQQVRGKVLAAKSAPAGLDEAAAKPAAPVRKPDIDEGSFWDDADDDSGAHWDRNNDDAEQPTRNPLVKGRVRAVDLKASIKSQAESIEEQKKEMIRAVPQQEADEPEPELEPPQQGPPAPAVDPLAEYGDLDRLPVVTPAAPKPKPEPRKVIKRQRFRGRRRGRATGEAEGEKTED
jgi:hypothetical protein